MTAEVTPNSLTGADGKSLTDKGSCCIFKALALPGVRLILGDLFIIGEPWVRTRSNCERERYSSVFWISNSRVWNLGMSSPVPVEGANMTVRFPVQMHCFGVRPGLLRILFKVHDITHLSTVGIPKGISRPLTRHARRRTIAYTLASALNLQLHVLQAAAEPCQVESWKRCSMDLELLRASTCPIGTIRRW